VTSLVGLSDDEVALGRGDGVEIGPGAIAAMAAVDHQLRPAHGVGELVFRLGRVRRDQLHHRGDVFSAVFEGLREVLKPVRLGGCWIDPGGLESLSHALVGGGRVRVQLGVASRRQSRDDVLGFGFVGALLIEADCNGGVELPIGKQFVVLGELGGRDAELLHGLLVETSGILEAMVGLEFLQRLDRLVTELSVRTVMGQLVTGRLQGFLHFAYCRPLRVLGEFGLS
jgi:hypothetical protein